MRLDRKVAEGVNEACWARARHDLRWNLWEEARRKYDRDDVPAWFRRFSGVVAAQYLSGSWPPYNGWFTVGEFTNTEE